MAPRSHAYRMLALLFPLVAGSVACGGAGDAWFLLNLGSVPPAAMTIQIRGSLDGNAAGVDQMELAAGLSRVAMKVPAAATGGFSIDLQALDADRCVQGTAQTTVSLPMERGKEVVADFMTLVPRKCDNPPKPPACAKNTLCTYAFSPTDQLLYGAHAIASNDIWAVGNAGTVLHWDGTVWRKVNLGTASTSRNLYDVWASGPNDVWVVGATGSMAADRAIILRWDGIAWTTALHGSTRDLNGIHGLSANEIYAVGENTFSAGDPGEFWKWNGSQWSPMSNNVNGRLWRVWAVSSTEIWAMGLSNTLLKHNGSMATSVSLSSIGATSSTQFRQMWGTDSNNLFLVGSQGFAARYAGTWSRITQSATTLHTLYSVYGTTATGTVYAVGGGGWMFRSDPPYTSFLPLADPPIINTDLRELAIAQDGTAWISGVGGYLGQLGMQ